jgi:hypothetical protein
MQTQAISVPLIVTSLEDAADPRIVAAVPQSAIVLVLGGERLSPWTSGFVPRRSQAMQLLHERRGLIWLEAALPAEAQTELGQALGAQLIAMPAANDRTVADVRVEIDALTRAPFVAGAVVVHDVVAATQDEWQARLGEAGIAHQAYDARSGVLPAITSPESGVTLVRAWEPLVAAGRPVVYGGMALTREALYGGGWPVGLGASRVAWLSARTPAADVSVPTDRVWHRVVSQEQFGALCDHASTVLRLPRRLIVADPQRLRAPYIGSDAEFLALVEALKHMESQVGLLEAVKVRLQAGRARDLEELSAQTSWPADRLARVFRDLDAARA